MARAQQQVRACQHAHAAPQHCNICRYIRTLGFISVKFVFGRPSQEDIENLGRQADASRQ
jgi:hypothetical protein